LTKPTVKTTYGHGFFDDCNDATNWSEGESGLTCAMTVDADDYFLLTGTCDSVNDEYAYYINDITNSSTDVYTKYWIRWRTTDSSGVGISSNGLGLLAYFTFTSGNQCIVGGATEIPQFSSDWTVTSGTITPGKIIDSIRIEANDYPNSIASGTYIVWIDYILLCQGEFTLPNTMHGLDFNAPPKYANIPIPSRITDITQTLGTEPATVTASYSVDRKKLATTAKSCTGNDWLRPQAVDADSKSDYIPAQVLYEISHNSHKEPCQWLTVEDKQFKATLEEITERHNREGHVLDLEWREYSRGGKKDKFGYAETVVERFGLNL